MKIKEALQIAKEKIRKKGLEENASLLLVEELSGVNNRTELFLKLDEDRIQDEEFYQALQRYLAHEPLQYILKSAWFCNEKFYVDSRVLIPRMETEEMVVKAIEIIKNISHATVFDVCTGSGCIALMLKKEVSDIEIIGSDISSSALEVARINQERMHIKDIKWLVSDMFGQYPIKKADMIISNPPYIDQKEEIEKDVLNHEPYIALVPPSGDGLEFYRRFLKEIPFHLKEGGYFIAEFGYQQKKSLEEEIKKCLPHAKVQFYRDISGKDRYFVLQYFE